MLSPCIPAIEGFHAVSEFRFSGFRSEKFKWIAERHEA